MIAYYIRTIGQHVECRRPISNRDNWPFLLAKQSTCWRLLYTCRRQLSTCSEFYIQSTVAKKPFTRRIRHAGGWVADNVDAELQVRVHYKCCGPCAVTCLTKSNQRPRDTKHEMSWQLPYSENARRLWSLTGSQALLVGFLEVTFALSVASNHRVAKVIAARSAHWLDAGPVSHIVLQVHVVKGCRGRLTRVAKQEMRSKYS